MTFLISMYANSTVVPITMTKLMASTVGLGLFFGFEWQVNLRFFCFLPVSFTSRCCPPCCGRNRQWLLTKSNCLSRYLSLSKWLWVIGTALVVFFMGYYLKTGYPPYSYMVFTIQTTEGGRCGGDTFDPSQSYSKECYIKQQSTYAPDGYIFPPASMTMGLPLPLHWTSGDSGYGPGNEFPMMLASSSCLHPVFLYLTLLPGEFRLAGAPVSWFYNQHPITRGIITRVLPSAEVKVDYVIGEAQTATLPLEGGGQITVAITLAETSSCGF